MTSEWRLAADSVITTPVRPRAVLVETECKMTETRDPDIITEALAIIDRALGEMTNRELVSTIEVSDLLLDVRSLLVHPIEPAKS